MLRRGFSALQGRSGVGLPSPSKAGARKWRGSFCCDDANPDIDPEIVGLPARLQGNNLSSARKPRSASLSSQQAYPPHKGMKIGPENPGTRASWAAASGGFAPANSQSSFNNQKLSHVPDIGGAGSIQQPSRVASYAPAGGRQPQALASITGFGSEQFRPPSSGHPIASPAQAYTASAGKHPTPTLMDQALVHRNSDVGEQIARRQSPPLARQPEPANVVHAHGIRPTSLLGHKLPISTSGRSSVNDNGSIRPVLERHRPALKYPEAAHLTQGHNVRPNSQGSLQEGSETVAHELKRANTTTSNTRQQQQRTRISAELPARQEDRRLSVISAPHPQFLRRTGSEKPLQQPVTSLQANSNSTTAKSFAACAA